MAKVNGDAIRSQRYYKEDNQLTIDIIDALYFIGLALPPICFIDILKKMIILLPLLHELPNTNVYSFEEIGIGLNLLMLLLSGSFYLTLCILIDMKVFTKLMSLIRADNEKFPSRGKIDSDVLEEIERVNTMTEEQVLKSNLVAWNLSKLYGNFLAVNQLSFSIEQGECFGL
jgi:hypothetical protein